MDIKEKLKQVLATNQSSLTINELLEQLNEPFTSITAREAIWQLIDQDVIELTPDRKFKYLGEQNGKA